MNNSYLLLFLSTLILTTLAAEQTYKKIIHSTDPEGRCLDGTYPGLYLHEGGDTKNILIYFLGGGYCGQSTTAQTLESCYQRSKGLFGSSAPWPEQVNLGGCLSTDPSSNKFASWTKVLLLYCDGAMHQGSTRTPIKYKDTQLIFRGADNVRSHLKWLTNKYNLPNAQRVVLTGGSAGGIATYLWSNYVRNLLKDPNALYTIVDSGVFINASSTVTQSYKLDVSIKNLFKLSNLDEQTPLEVCNKRYSIEDQYKCLFLQNSFSSLIGRVLLINSQYDSWAIQNTLDINCLSNGTSGKSLSKCSQSDLQHIQNYRKSYLNFLNNFLLFSKNGAWTISCSTHVYSLYSQFYDVPAEKVPQNTGITVRQAMEKFVFEGIRITAIDQDSWPKNAPCAY